MSVEAAVINYWIALSPKLVINFAMAESGIGVFPGGTREISEDTFRMLSRHIIVPEDISPFKRSDEYECWNCYSKRGASTSLIVSDLNAIMKIHPQDFIVLGAWHFEPSEDGVGRELTREKIRGKRGKAPVFIQPPELLAKLVKDGGIRTGALVAGQAPRG